MEFTARATEIDDMLLVSNQLKQTGTDKDKIHDRILSSLTLSSLDVPYYP